jgi:hypothetical protein
MVQQQVKSVMYKIVNNSFTTIIFFSKLKPKKPTDSSMSSGSSLQALQHANNVSDQNPSFSQSKPTTEQFYSDQQIQQSLGIVKQETNNSGSHSQPQKQKQIGRSDFP